MTMHQFHAHLQNVHGSSAKLEALRQLGQVDRPTQTLGQPISKMPPWG